MRKGENIECHGRHGRTPLVARDLTIGAASLGSDGSRDRFAAESFSSIEISRTDECL